MANVLAELFANTADAIREKTGDTGTMKPAEFPEKIRGIEMDCNLIPLSITKNGSYYPITDIECGKAYTFKASYTEEELETLASLGTYDGVIYKLYSKGDSYLCISPIDGKVLSYYVSSTEIYMYSPKVISIINVSEGWNFSNGGEYAPIDTPPKIVFEESGTVLASNLSAFPILFNVRDGFSYVTVNVENSGAVNLVPLVAKENGTYLPFEDVKVGKSYSLKSTFTQEKLLGVYNLSETRTPINDFTNASLLYSNSDGTMFAALCFTLGGASCYGLMIECDTPKAWFPIEVVTAMGLGSSDGWYETTDMTNYTPLSTSPNFTFSGDGSAFVSSVSDLSSLFNTPLADGFSSVTVDVKNSGSVEDAVVWNVTFIGADGSVLCQKLCLDGDDCYDPVITGKISTPTKESTVQYTYAYNGWSLTDGGAADGNALSAVTSDRTVYAAFTANLVYYTVRFFDGDILMKTERVAYGSKATPPDTFKESYVFNGWGTDDFTITQDTDFYGIWTLDNSYIRTVDNPIELEGVDILTTKYSVDGTKFFVMRDQTTLEMYDATTMPYTFICSKTLDRNYGGIAVDPNGNLLAVGLAYVSTSSKPIQVFSISDTGLTETSNVPNRSGGSNYGVFNYDGTMYACASTGTIYLYSVGSTSWTLTKTLTYKSDYSISLAFYEDILIYGLGKGRSLYGTTMYAYNVDGTNVTSEVFSSVIRQDIKSLNMTPDGKYLIVRGQKSGNSYDQFSLWVYDMTGSAPHSRLYTIPISTYNETTTSIVANDELLIIGLNTAPYMAVHEIATGKKLVNPAFIPESTFGASAGIGSYNYRNNHFCITPNASPYLCIYEVVS